MKVITTNQMRLIENNDVSQGRYSKDDLAVLVALALQNKVVEDGCLDVLILCGDNNNGDYGFTLASILNQNTNINVKVIYLSENKDNRYLKLCLKLAMPVIDNIRDCQEVIDDAKYIVDCLHGCELDQMIEYPESYLIQLVNQSGAYVLSCDIPSGLDGNDGSLFGSCIKADCTMALHLPKVGCFIKPGCLNVGEMIVESIGLSYDSLQLLDDRLYLLETNNKAHSLKPLTQIFNTLVAPGINLNDLKPAINTLKVLNKLSIGDNYCFSDASSNDKIQYASYESVKIDVDNDIRRSVDKLNMDDYGLICFNAKEKQDNSYQHLVKKALESNSVVTISKAATLTLKEHLDLLTRPNLTILYLDKQQYDYLFNYQQINFVDELVSLTNKYPNLLLIYNDVKMMVAYQNKAYFIQEEINQKASLMDGLVTLVALEMMKEAKIDNAMDVVSYFNYKIKDYAKTNLAASVDLDYLLDC